MPEITQTSPPGKEKITKNIRGDWRFSSAIRRTRGFRLAF